MGVCSSVAVAVTRIAAVTQPTAAVAIVTALDATNNINPHPHPFTSTLTLVSLSIVL